MKCKTFYTYLKLSKINFNLAQKPICNYKDYVSCKKNNECLIDICGQKADEIVKFCINVDFSREKFELYRKRIDTWRKKCFKKCKKYICKISEVK